MPRKEIDPFDRALNSIITALTALSLPSDEQIRYLETLGVRDSADELALEFDDAFRPLVGYFSKCRLRPETEAALKAVDARLKGMSGSQNSELWRLAALSERQEWQSIRELSAHAQALIESDT